MGMIYVLNVLRGCPYPSFFILWIVRCCMFVGREELLQVERNDFIGDAKNCFLLLGRDRNSCMLMMMMMMVVASKSKKDWKWI